MKTNDWNRKKRIGKVIAFLAVLLAAGLPKGVAAQVYGSGFVSVMKGAPSGTVTNLRQTGATKDSVDIQFDGFLGTDVKYAVMIGTSANAVNTDYMTATGATATISGLASGSTYYVKIVPYSEEYDSYDSDADDTSSGQYASAVKSYGNPSNTISVVTAPGEAPSAVSQTDSDSENGSVTVSWSTAYGANGYRVEYYLMNSEAQVPEKATLTTTSTTAVLTGLSAKKTYTAHVIPCRISSEGYVAYDETVYAEKNNLAIGATVAGTPQGTVTSLVQKSAAADSATLSFVLPDPVAQYSVQLSTTKDGTFTEAAVATESEVSLTELKAGTTYYVRVVPFYPRWNAFNEEYDRTYGTASGLFEIVTTPGTKPKKITQTAATVTGFTVQWDAADGASGYYVDYYCSGSTKKTTVIVQKNQIRLTGLERNSEYNIYVTPYRASASGFIAVDESNYTSGYSIPVKPSKAQKATVTKFWKSIGKVNLKTKKIECADGYQYALYTAYSETDQKVASISTTAYSSADIKSAKLRKSAVFKVRVRAYITIDDKKVYGAWSDWNYIGAPVTVTLSRSSSAVHASWSRVKGADRYIVYISTSKYYNFKKCFVTTNTSCDIKSYGSKSIKTGKKYYVYVVPQIKVSKRYVSVTKREAVAAIK